MLNSLGEQRGRLKKAHRTVLDIANVLGLSNSLLQMIERREFGDRVIVFGGMVLTCIILIACWWYVARG